MFVLIILMESTSYVSGEIKSLEKELAKAKAKENSASKGIYYHSFHILRDSII